MKMIELKNVSYSYPSSESKTLDDISFSIESGEFVSIVGHNGSGKSTLARILIGLLSPQTGDVVLFDELLSKKNIASLRSKMALVFQNPDNQFIGATVEDDIAFGLENRRVANVEMQPIINKYAELVGMTRYLKREPAFLSGGQKQRVAIAGALALSPEIIIFDEATSMLDPKGKKDIFELIKKLKADNPKLTIVSITHEIEEAYESDRVIVLAKGKIIANGKPDEVLANKEMCEEAHLKVPFYLELKNKLKEAGFDVKNAKNTKEVTDLLCR